LGITDAESIESAELGFYFISGGPGSCPRDDDEDSLCVITRPWDSSSVTWNYSKAIPGDTVKWNSPGGDFNREQVSVAQCARPENWETFNVTDAVKGFIAKPDSNKGFIFIADTASEAPGRTFHSEFSQITGLRPRMIINLKTK